MYPVLVKRLNLKEFAKEAVLKYISDMDLEKSNKLPTEEQFSAIIGVSRITLRAALNELDAEGVIFRRQGKGTFVNVIVRGMGVNLNPTTSIWDIIKNNNYIPRVHILDNSIIDATENIARRLKIELGSHVIVSRRIFYANSKFCSYCIDIFKESLVSENDFLELEIYNHSIFQFLYEKAGQEVSWNKVEIGTTDNIQTSELNYYINLSDRMTKSFLCLKSVSYDKNDNPLVYSIEYIDSEIIRYNLVRNSNINYIAK